jgi:hypothetical protein
MQDGACRCNRRCFIVQSKAFKRNHAELVFKQRNSIVGRENPVLERRLSEAGALAKLLQRKL